MTADCCPVIIVAAGRRLVTRTYFDDDLQSCYNAIVHLIQNGVGINGGITTTAFGAQAIMDAAPGFGVIQGDIANGYKKISREGVLTAIKAHASIGNTVAFSQALIVPLAYIGIGNDRPRHYSFPLRGRRLSGRH